MRALRGGSGFRHRNWAVTGYVTRLVTPVTRVGWLRWTSPGWLRPYLVDLVCPLLLLVEVSHPGVWLESGSFLLGRPCREHHLGPFSFVESLAEGLGHAEADMLAQESMEGQLLLGGCGELRVTMSGVQALSFLAVAAG